jgi:hypothetical protein
MNSSQEAKALQGLFDGRNLPMGYVIQGKKKQQVFMIYEPWAVVIRWLFQRFKELDSLSKLCREIEAMPYLFPDPSADDFLTYTFKISMTKVPGGFKPSCVETVKYMLCNPSYMGAWLYDGSIVRNDNHPAIVDKDLFLWAYHKITGRNLDGELLEGVERYRSRDSRSEAVLKHILRDTKGILYVTHPEQPEYVRQVPVRDHSSAGKLYRDITFTIRAHLIDDIFLERIKALAIADLHIAETIEQSIISLEEKHAEQIVSIDDQLASVRLEIEKTLAFLHDEILTLTAKEKGKYNQTLAGLRDREQALIDAQNEAQQTDLKADYQELADLLADIPGKLDGCTMERKHKLAKLITESAVIEEVSVHWLRLTVLWRGPLANRPDVCLIWRQRGRRSDEWTAQEDDIVRASYPTGHKWDILEALPRRSWNMIYQRAMEFGLRRNVYAQESIPENITVDDLNVIPDRTISLSLAMEAGKRRKKQEFQAYGVWLFSAGLMDLAEELEHRNIVDGSLPSQVHRRSNVNHSRLDPTSISR